MIALCETHVAVEDFPGVENKLGLLGYRCMDVDHAYIKNEGVSAGLLLFVKSHIQTSVWPLTCLTHLCLTVPAAGWRDSFDFGGLVCF